MSFMDSLTIGAVLAGTLRAGEIEQIPSTGVFMRVSTVLRTIMAFTASGSRLTAGRTPLCVPRTSSALISRRNRLTSAHHDSAARFRTGRLGLAI
jgi:hypothetical protein